MAADNKRTPRNLESRELFERPTSWKPPSLLPDPDPVEGWTFRWVRKSMYGETDASNLSKKLREGYEPVKIADHPELHIMGNDKGEAEFGGLILCKIPTEFIQQKNAYYERQTGQQMESVDNSLMRESDPRMPIFNERRSNVTFGNGN